MRRRTDHALVLAPWQARAAAEGRLRMVWLPIPLLKGNHEDTAGRFRPAYVDERSHYGCEWMQYGAGGVWLPVRCPYAPGDTWWGQETWMVVDGVEDESLEILYRASNDIRPDGVSPESFGASRLVPCDEDTYAKYCADFDPDRNYERWRSAATMPRWASRIHGTITSVDVRRVQSITCDELWASGWPYAQREYPNGECGCVGAMDRYKQEWDARYAKRGLGFDADPWCWVIGMEVQP